MALVTKHYADFARNIVIGADGISDINFPTTCNSITIYLGTLIGTQFRLMLNYQDIEQGPDASWDKDFMTLPSGVIISIPSYEIRSLRVVADPGSDFSCWAFVTPGDSPSVTYSFAR